MPFNHPGSNQPVNSPPSSSQFEQSYHEELAELTPSKGLGFSELPFAIIGVVVLMIIVLFLVIPLRSEVRQHNRRLTELEDRLMQIETRSVQTGPSDMDNQKLVEQQGQLDQMSARMDRIETSLSVRLDNITKTLANTPLPKPPTKPVQSQAKNTGPVTEKASTLRYHIVKKGDTLYSIGRNNGLSVEALLKKNGLGSNHTIKPGEKLKVSP